MSTDDVSANYGSASFSDPNVANGITVTVSGITLSGAASGNYTLASTTTTTTASITQAATTTTLTTSANPSNHGNNVTFTASVSGGASGTPTGTVTFYDGWNLLGTGTLDGNGNATFSISTLAIGSHTINAVYGGDSNFSSSTSDSLTQVVQQGETTTTALFTPGYDGNTVTVTVASTTGMATFASPTGMAAEMSYVQIVGPVIDGANWDIFGHIVSVIDATQFVYSVDLIAWGSGDGSTTVQIGSVVYF